MARDVRELGGAWREYQDHNFVRPAPDLAPYVERYWMVSWAYSEPYRQLIVPYPNVHLTFQDGAATVNGVRTGHHIKVLDGAGRVFGVAFRPGSFRPFLGRPVSTITNRSVDAREVFPGDLPGPVDVATVEAFLRAHLPVRDAKSLSAAEHAVDVVARIAATPEITRVEALAHDLGTSVRGLQRLFAEHVGIGPKRVIRRYRLHEVTEQLARGARVAWGEVAADLGYADQAHLTRDFKEMFGETPTWYAERY
jgi:AraC-like DNA-binding protein